MSAAAEWMTLHRIFPRMFSIFYLYGMHQVAAWFMGLDVPTTEQAAFASVVITSAAAWFKFYVDASHNKRRGDRMGE